MWKTETISSVVKNETRVSTLSTSIQHSLGIPSQSDRQEEEIKGIQTGKEEVKLSLLADDVIVYLKDLKNCTKKLLATINSFSKVEYQCTKISSISILYQ
jgi:hypothetical protein